MGLRTKINLLLAAVFIMGLVLFAAVFTPILAQVGREEVVQVSRIMMESSAGTRKYTSVEVAPILKADISRNFHPQSVSAYAAMKSFQTLHAEYPDYGYREVALNPTNPEDRPVDWESDIVNDFRRNPQKREATLERKTSSGAVLELARPIVAAPACLECHDTARDAPRSMVAIYGPNNGFGWKSGEIIGAQIVSVPTSIATARADKLGVAFVIPFILLFVLLFAVVNIALNLMIIGPVDAMASQAESVSMGAENVPDYVRKGSDQIARLSAAINRMRRSLTEAMRMLDS